MCCQCLYSNLDMDMSIPSDRRSPYPSSPYPPCILPPHHLLRAPPPSSQLPRPPLPPGRLNTIERLVMWLLACSLVAV